MAIVVLVVVGGRVRSEVRRGGREQGESERGRADRDDVGAFTHTSRGSAASRRRRGASRARVRCPASAYWQRLGMTGTRPGGLGQHR